MEMLNELVLVVTTVVVEVADVTACILVVRGVGRLDVLLVALVVVEV